MKFDFDDMMAHIDRENGTVVFTVYCEDTKQDETIEVKFCDISDLLSVLSDVWKRYVKEDL